MILSCPACATRYVVDPRSLGTDGRRVRCARCRHVWIATAPPEAIAAAAETITPPEPAVAPPQEPNDAPPPEPAPAFRPTPGTNLPARRSKIPRGLVLGWAALAAAVVGLAAFVYAARDDIADAWPATRRLYDLLGIEVAAAPAAPEHPQVLPHFEVREVATDFVEAAGALTLRVRGRVVNLAPEAFDVPDLRATLLGADGRRLRSWTFQPHIGRLGPGESSQFETVLENPTTNAERLEVTLAAGAAPAH